MSFKNMEDGLKNLTAKYSKAFNLEEVIDVSDTISDDPAALGFEVSRQPAIFAYVANMKRIADANHKTFTDKLEQFKDKKLKVVTEYLKADGVIKPTAKMIEARFNQHFIVDEFLIALKEKLKLWESRKEMLAIVLKSVESREQSFKSLSYMMDTMIKAGIMYPKHSNRGKV